MSNKIEEGWKKSGDKQRAAIADVISNFTRAHGDYYDYSKVVYIRNRDNVEIICPIHGEFWQTPRTHKEGGNCPKCAISSMAKSKELSSEDNIKSFTNVHGNLYDYSNVQYCGSHIHVDIGCHIHGIFKQTPTTHRKGSGCPKCCGRGFNLEAPAVLYYVKVSHHTGTYYKIGITNRNVVERFGKDMQYITVLKTWAYDVGADAYKVEQSILELNKDCKYTGSPILKSGNTEMFYKDVGGYDN